MSAEAARTLCVPAQALEEALFADLPFERLVELPETLPGPHELALRANLALAQAFLQRSARVTLSVRGNARAVVRQVRLRRLLCSVRPRMHSGGATIDLSGPYSLFRRTTLYGRALASLVPALQACDHFQLRADAVLRGLELRVCLQSGDPIFADATLGRRYDSRLEERFAQEFRKHAPDFDLIREPEPLVAGDHLIFPDFAIHARRDPTRCVLLEIVGFWTPAYLEGKLRRLRSVRGAPMILCIDDALNCSEASTGLHPVVRYRRRIDVGAVLQLVRTMLGSGA